MQAKDMLMSNSLPIKPPSITLKEEFDKMTYPPNESMYTDLSRKVMLPVREVKMWLDHSQTNHDNHKNKAAETRRKKKVEVIVSRVTISITALVLPVLTTHSMELGYHFSNTLMALLPGFSEILLLFLVTLREAPRETQLNCLTPIPMCPPLLCSDKFLPYHCLVGLTKQIVS